MKRLLILLVMMLCISPAMGFSATFQNSGDFTNYISCFTGYGGSGSNCKWAHNSTGENSWIYTSNPNYLTNKDPLQTTYWAATKTSAGDSVLYLFDSSYVEMDTLNSGATPIKSRVEMIITGGVAKLYVDGILRDTSVALPQNPSYIGVIYELDDLVYGTTENKYIFSVPETGVFIKKDLLNPAASGLCFPNGTIISNYNMTTTWGKGTTNASETIILKEWSSGHIAYSNIIIPGHMAGTIKWPLQEALFNNPNAAYGYYVTTIEGSGKVSDVIPYIAYGATVSFDHDSYSYGDTALVSWVVTAGGYWDVLKYTYRMDIIDVYGNVIDTQSVITQTGTESVQFSTSNPTGVYYAVLIAEPIGGGSDIWMNYDTAELQEYILFAGYVMNAESGVVIPLAYINVTQGTSVKNSLSMNPSGAWNSTNNWLSGSQFNITTNKTGYITDVRLFTPIISTTINLNISLIPNPPTTVGVSIGGIVRDDVYSNPVVGAMYVVQNGSSTGNAITNIAGFARVDSLTNNVLYDVWSSKTGYGNSTVAKKLAVGA